MILESTIWNILREHVPHGQWVSIGQIFAIVELHGKFDSADLQERRTNSHTPVWRTMVRRVLEKKKKAGMIHGRKRA